MNKFKMQGDNIKKWDVIYDYIKKNHKDVLDPNIVIKEYILKNNKKETIEGAMELLDTNWWIDPKKYTEEINKEKIYSKMELEASNKNWQDTQTANDAKGFKNVQVQRDKEAQAKGFSDFNDMMHRSVKGNEEQLKIEQLKIEQLKIEQLEKELLKIQAEHNALSVEHDDLKSKGKKTFYYRDVILKRQIELDLQKFRITSELSKLKMKK